MSKLKLITALIVYAQTISPFCFSSVDSNKMISKINQKVHRLEQRIANNELQMFSIEHFTFHESAPAKVQFHFENEKLRVVYLKIAHETWLNKFCYYFDEDENIMKFLKITLYRDDNPPRKAIFYNKDGGIIWKNTENSPLDPKVLKEKIIRLSGMLKEIEKGHSKF
jgi:hypothetical protein